MLRERLFSPIFSSNLSMNSSAGDVWVLIFSVFSLGKGMVLRGGLWSKISLYFLNLEIGVPDWIRRSSQAAWAETQGTKLCAGRKVKNSEF